MGEVSACIGDSKKKLQILENRDITPAEHRRMIELASTEEGKKIVKFLKSNETKLTTKGSNGEILFTKLQNVYNASPANSLMLVEQVGEQHPNHKQVVVVDNETGENIPFVSMVIGKDTMPLFTLGVPPEELERRAIYNTEILSITSIDNKNFTTKNKERIAAKIKNKKVEKNTDYWDTWLSPLGQENAEKRALYSIRLGLHISNAFQLINQAFSTIMNVVMYSLFEVDFHHGAALNSLRAISHSKITESGEVSFNLKSKPINLPLVPALITLRLYAIKNNLPYVENPIIYIPGTSQLLVLQGKAFDYDLLFEAINVQAPLAQLAVKSELVYRDYSYLVCTGRHQESGRTVVFMILHIHCIQSAFESIFASLGTGTAQHFVDNSRIQLINGLRPVFQNGGMLNVLPYILDGTSPGAFISILNNLKEPKGGDDPVPTSLSEEQKQIKESWKELAPMSAILESTLPFGVYKDDNGEIVDNKQSKGSFMNLRAAIFDYDGCSITE